jgi:dolichol-phosphate mannosyltransferase
VKSKKTVIAIPTYNEGDNARRMCEEIHELGIDTDLLFVDDASPDGTGEVLEAIKPRFPRLIVQHRPGKLGIGSAHAEMILWAYDHGYETLVTLDCDFTHSPRDIPKMLEAVEGYEVSIGTRFVREDSLPGWTAARKALTRGGHFLTSKFLGMPFDASGAFRVYDLTRVPRGLFELIRATGYAFFFESLFILARNGMRIHEIPIVLPSRESGSSKMSLVEIGRWGGRLVSLSVQSLLWPSRFKLLK